MQIIRYPQSPSLDFFSLEDHFLDIFLKVDDLLLKFGGRQNISIADGFLFNLSGTGIVATGLPNDICRGRVPDPMSISTTSSSTSEDRLQLLVASLLLLEL